MPIKLPKRIGLGVATGALAVALSGLPISFDHGLASLDGKVALADAGGNGKANGHGHGQGKGKGAVSDSTMEAKAGPAKGQVTKDDPMHPSNLGRLNGFMHASPQALANASPNSAIGTLSKTYRDALVGYAESDDTVTTEDLAGILAEAANKPLTGEQVISIHGKLIAANPELAEDEAVTAQLTDETFADDLAEQANEIQATEANQGLGSGDDADEANEDSGDVAEGDDSEDDGAVADAAQTVADAAVDTADAIGDFIDDTF